jgi:hypothetical protein
VATWTTLLYLVERLPLKAFIIAWRIVAAYGVDWRVWRVWIEEEQPVHRVCFLVLLCSWQKDPQDCDRITARMSTFWLWGAPGAFE